MTDKRRLNYRHLPRGLEILYEDDCLIVIDKPAGLLTVGTASNKTKTAYYVLTDYVRKGCAKPARFDWKAREARLVKAFRFASSRASRGGRGLAEGGSRNRIFIVHRLDQWTSGVLIFAKSEEIKMRLQEQWKDTQKKYLAIVHGKLNEKEGVISSYLAENKAFVVYSTKDPSKGKLSHTAYKVIKETEQPARGRGLAEGGFSMLEINLLTGRKNQIRVHLTDIGHPIAGDRKYGNTDDGLKRLALHAKSISFKHPMTGKQMTFESKPPSYFNNLMKNSHIG